MRVPSSTYRLQLSGDFTLDAARETVPYLDALGVSDLYLSPILQSRMGSTHGYDVTDSTRVRDELGGEAALMRLANEVHARGMGILLDIVPNHMAASVENPWWKDVLRSGPASRYAATFDIDWEPARAGLAGKVLLPILTTHYGEALENGDLRITHGDDGLELVYAGMRLPLSPRSQATVLGWNLARLERSAAADPVVLDYAQLVDELASAGPHEGAASAPERLRRLVAQDERIRAHVDANLRRWNGRPGDARSFDLLDRLLDAQHYRVAYWPVADQEINYRRFFAINDLVAVRVEDERVFTERLGTIIRLVREGLVDGLRVDHVDGLHDPARFLERLRGAVGSAPYVVVEKILGPDEELPAWPIQGTTGYEVLNAVNDQLVEPRGLAALAALGQGDRSFADVVYHAKRAAVTDLFGGELRNLAQRLGRLAEQHRHGRDLTLTALGRALVGVTACLPIYRTYVDSFRVGDHDRAAVELSVAEASRRDPDASRAIAFIRRVLLLDIPGRTGPAQRALWLRFVMRWQQLASAAMAKGQEDTAFYRHVVLASRNEVGGHPERPPIGVPEFHERMRRRAERWPNALSATATHDTKRGADVRARIDALTQLPGETADRFRSWRAWCGARVEGAGVGNDMALLLFETLVGAWPVERDEAFGDRIAAYAVKAAREAKERTRWGEPDEEYESVLVRYARAIVDAPEGDPERRAFVAFAERVAERAVPLSLAAALLTLTLPGAPDIYQGSELWDLSLVDPDNRRPVDFAKRRARLSEIGDPTDRASLSRALLARWRDGTVKLHVITTVLQLRRDRRDVFDGGTYEALAVPRGSPTIAFARASASDRVVVAVRPCASHVTDEGALPVATAGVVMRDLFTQRTLRSDDGRIPLTSIFEVLPVALLATAER